MMSQIVKWIVFKCIYPFWYFMCSKKRVEDRKILFVENHLPKLSDNYTLLYETLEKKGYHLTVHYLQVADSSWKDIIPRTLHMLKDMATARCVFLSESNSVFGCIALRKETKLVQLWHACGAFKKWGFSVAEKSFGEDSKNLLRYSGHRNYTLVPVSGQAVCWAYAQAFGLSEQAGIIKPLGVSRTDMYYDVKAHARARQKLSKLPLSIGNRRVMLYAPTFRGDIKQAKAPDKLDIKQIYDRFHNEYVLFIKQHPFIRERMDIPKSCENFAMEITNQLTTEELLMTADLCITDYSSVVFDYSLMEKPMFFFAYDLEEYYDERGFYYPYEEFVPGPIVKNTSELIEGIENIKQYDMEKIRKFKAAYMTGCDGHATERILEAVL